jgi:transposase InsO family protein
LVSRGSCTNSGRNAFSAAWLNKDFGGLYSSAPKYVIRDRDKIYGADFARRVPAMGIEQVLTAPRSPWQNPYCERVIGTLRRDCLDHVIVVGEQHLRRILRKHLEYHHGSRTHLALGKDAPSARDQDGCRVRLAHVELSATHVRVRVLSDGSSSRVSRPIPRGGQRSEERHDHSLAKPA